MKKKKPSKPAPASPKKRAGENDERDPPGVASQPEDDRSASLSHIREKLKVTSAAELVAYAARWNQTQGVT
ncbi:MAG: hypothetical protein ABI674_09925 [Spartobacteria bacterium]